MPITTDFQGLMDGQKTQLASDFRDALYLLQREARWVRNEQARATAAALETEFLARPMATLTNSQWLHMLDRYDQLRSTIAPRPYVAPPIDALRWIRHTPTPVPPPVTNAETWAQLATLTQNLPSDDPLKTAITRWNEAYQALSAIERASDENARRWGYLQDFAALGLQNRAQNPSQTPADITPPEADVTRRPAPPAPKPAIDPLILLGGALLAMMIFKGRR